MTPLLALALLTAGDATYYAPGVMDEVYANRLAWGQVQPCPACVGYVALMDSRDIGRLVWLDWGDVTEGPYQVIDCAAAQHRAGLVARGRVVEVDYATALRHRMAGPVPVRVLWRPPEPACGSPGRPC